MDLGSSGELRLSWTRRSTVSSRFSVPLTSLLMDTYSKLSNCPRPNTLNSDTTRESRKLITQANCLTTKNKWKNFLDWKKLTLRLTKIGELSWSGQTPQLLTQYRFKLNTLETNLLVVVRASPLFTWTRPHNRRPEINRETISKSN
jgi:hypothetical protein